MKPIPIPQDLSDLPADEARRVRIGIASRDCDAIPKVAGAGQCFITDEGPIQLMHNGVKVRLDGYCGAWMTRLIALLRGHHEPQEERVFHAVLPFVRPGAIMLELGAFWAYYSLWFAQAVPDASTILVEPHPEHLAVARDNLALNGRRAIVLPAQCGARSAPRAAHPGVAEGVEQVCVDDLVRRLDLDHIDLLHADIQGAELQMLHGMRNVIREGRVRFIFISTHHHSISDDPLIHQKCLRFLREHSAHILSEHTVAESFSGDGLIVASFAPEDRALPHIPLTLNRAGDNLFPEPEADLALARDELRRARQAIASARLALPAWVRTTSLEAGADVSTLLAALEQEREMAARPIRSPLRRSQPRSNVERAEAVRSNPMAPLKSLVSTFRGAIWLLRGSGLREQVRALGRRLDGLQAQMTESAHAAAALSRAARSRAVVRGHAMLLNPDDNVVSRLLAESGGIEWFETDLIEREVHEGDTVLDLGANIGYFTLQFARLVGPRGRVIAFEPDPVNANLLKRNVSLNGYHNVEIVRKAVADRTGESELHLCDNNHGDHRLYSSGDGRTTIKVPMTTIDDHFGANPPAVNLIKMDIQGSEPRALRGMDRTLKNSPSASLITEFWPIGLSQAGDSAAGFLTQLQRLGFDISEICESEERLQPIESLQLLRDYTPENSRHTNLFCTRGRA